MIVGKTFRKSSRSTKLLCYQYSILFTQERDTELLKEAQRQERNDELRRTFAQHANTFHAWLTETRAMLVDGSGTLESQLEAVKVMLTIMLHAVYKYTRVLVGKKR